MLAEVTIVLKDDSRTIRQKHLVYDPFQCDTTDPVIENLIDETRKNFDGIPTDVQVKISMTV